jgi:hypothetical protein
MTDREVSSVWPGALTARTEPAPIGAGVSFSMTLRLEPADGGDLTGRRVDILDAEGAVLASTGVAGRAEPSEAGAEPMPAAWVTDPVDLTAPQEPGTTDWRVVLRDLEADAGIGPSARLALNVQSHVLGLSVWEIPQVLHPGRPFAFKVGLACADGCHTSGWPVEVCAPDGTVLAAGVMGAETWRGTAGLHFTEIEALAPEDIGQHMWSVRTCATTPAVSHAEAQAAVHLHVTPEPEFHLRIEVLDSATGRPLKGAKVVAHPYRTTADENGIAELSVHRGEYRLFVSGPAHIPRRFDSSISQDLSMRAALSRDEGFADADLW